MPYDTLASSVLLPELRLLRVDYIRKAWMHVFHVEKVSEFEICPHCAQPSYTVYDHRTIRVKDSPIRGKHVRLVIRKRRFRCKPCKRVFMEPVPGILPRKRTTQRFKRSVLAAAEKFSDLKAVRQTHQCSAGFLYSGLYEQLELEQRKRQYPWPRVVGIDEHAFRRNKRLGCTEFASMIVHYKRKTVMEVVEGKTVASLESQLGHIPGRENVEWAIIDMCDPFKNYITRNLPNARIVADKFHVLRLLTPALLRRRKEITGTRADLRAKKLLLMSGKKLGYARRHTLLTFLENHPEMKELYLWKERLHRFYRIRDYLKASRAFRKMVDEMSWCSLPEIKTLRKTLLKWKEEILNYFLTGYTNARTEGFNNKAKVVKRRAYGYKSFRNYRLRLLHACAH